MTFTSTNPYTGKFLASYEAHTAEETNSILDVATRAQQAWRTTSMQHRSNVLNSIAALLIEQAPELAVRITQEMGKPIVQSRAEIVKCASACTYMAENAASVLATQFITTEFPDSHIQYEPLGTVLCIMPWNFPYWQFFRFAAPALMAGNAILLKHAPNTWGCALDMVALCEAGGLPRGLVQCLLLDVPAIESVIADPRVHAVTFTGSTAAGSSVGSLAGKYIKKSVLELGGSDAYIVFDDADVERAAELCAESRCINSGQSCIAAKRFIVHNDVAEQFTALLTKFMTERIVGDPMIETTQIGPLARPDLQAHLSDQVQRAINGGAVPNLPLTVSQGASKAGGEGPLVLTNVRPGNPAFDEELFGPVAAVTTFSTEEEAVDLANHSIYGLGSAVFTSDAARAQRLADSLQAGTVYVNTFVRSDARLPFGGIKQSGYGRELGGHGLLEFVNIKTVVRNS